MSSPNLTEIVATTLRNRTGKLADNVTTNNALIHRLREQGKVWEVDGGRTIVQELEYQENQTYKRYLGYETLNISPSDVFTAAEFNYAQAAIAVSISGLEQLQNSGKSALIDLLMSRIGNAERTFANNLSSDCYSDGTADGGKQIGGLQSLIADTPTSGTVGGIDRAVWAFWRNYSFSAVTNGGFAASAANIQDYMNRVYMSIVRYGDRPDLIIADNNYYRFYLESLTAIQRVTNEKMTTAGFMNLKFMDSDVVFDGGFQTATVAGSTVTRGAPSNHMYFLNTDYIFFRPHSERNMTPLAPDRFAVNQDAMVKLIGFAGNMTASNCFLQGVLKA